MNFYDHSRTLLADFPYVSPKSFHERKRAIGYHLPAGSHQLSADHSTGPRTSRYSRTTSARPMNSAREMIA